MAKASVNLQDSFLNQVRKDNSEIEMVLLDGTRLSGYVRGFDNFTVAINAAGNHHLVYKHAISQIIGRRGGSESQGGGRRTESRPKSAPRSEQAASASQTPSKTKETQPAKKFNNLDLSEVNLDKKE